MVPFLFLTRQLMIARRAKNKQRANMEPAEGATHFTSYQQARSILEQLNAQRSDDVFCDIILTVGDLRINAHRNVLSASCPYFQAMLTSCFTEASAKEVPIQGVDGAALKSIVDFFYTSNIAISQSNAEDILRVACLLQVAEVQGHCCSFLRSHMDVYNCVGILSIADALSCKELKESAFKYATKCFLDVSKCEEFLIMDKDVLSAIVSKEDFYVKVELDLYELLMRWVKHDVLTRKAHLFQLLSSVRLPLLGLNYLSQTVECDNLIKEDSQCLELVAKAKTYLESLDLKLGPNITLVFTVDSYGNCALTDQLELNMEWKQTTLLGVNNKSVQVLSLAVVDSSVYVRYISSTGHECCSRYDTSTDEWAVLRDEGLPMELQVNGTPSKEVIGANGCLYCLPGVNMPWIHKYDPRTDKWSKLPQPKTEFQTFKRLVAVGNCIYVIGSGPKGRSIRCFDTDTNKGRRLNTLVPTKVKHLLGVAAMKHVIYLLFLNDDDSPFGSKHSLGLKSYDTVQRKWADCAQPCAADRYNDKVNLIVYNGRLYAVGGMSANPNAPYLVVEVYDSECNTWSPCAGARIPTDHKLCATVQCTMQADAVLMADPALRRNARVESNLVRKDPNVYVPSSPPYEYEDSYNSDSDFENYDEDMGNSDYDDDNDDDNEEEGSLPDELIYMMMLDLI